MKDATNSKVPTVDNLNTLVPEQVKKAINETKVFLKGRFPAIKFNELGPIKLGTTDKYLNRLVVAGPKGGETPIFKVGGKGFMKEFLTSKQLALGPQAEVIIAQQNAEIRTFREQLHAAKARVENFEMEDLWLKRKKDELQALEDKITKVEARVEQLENDDDDEDSTTPLLDRKRELERQKKHKENYQQDRDKLQAEIAQHSKTRTQKVTQEKEKEAKLQTQLSTAENTRDTLEARLNTTKPVDDLRERDAELERKNNKDQQILDDENAPSSEEAARERIEERNKERARLRSQIQEREEALPLRERVKNIFKKYGWTLQAVVLAVSLVLGALALAGLNGLKASTKAVGKGLKTIGQKLGSLLPGLIGSIVSFIFKATGQVLSFLGEHAWLLILAVVAFFMEKLLKKRRKQ